MANCVWSIPFLTTPPLNILEQILGILLFHEYLVIFLENIRINVCGSVVKNSPAMQELQEMWIRSQGQEDPLERTWQPTPVFLPGESHGQRSLVGYGLEGCKESDSFLQSEFCRLVSVVLCVFSCCLYIKLVVWAWDLITLYFDFMARPLHRQ